MQINRLGYKSPSDSEESVSCYEHQPRRTAESSHLCPFQCCVLFFIVAI